jgi:hypothetical protein
MIQMMKSDLILVLLSSIRGEWISGSLLPAAFFYAVGLILLASLCRRGVFFVEEETV